MKEVVSIRLESELLDKLGLKETENKSEKIRKILEEYVKLKEEVKLLEEIQNNEKEIKDLKGKVNNLSNRLNKIEKEINGLKTSLESWGTFLIPALIGGFVAGSLLLLILAILKRFF
ncbi:hypothetical protein JCM9492_13410 [Aquifex pyrophilus]